MAREKGADAFVVSSDPDSIKPETGKIDLILNTVSAAHQLGTYFPLLRTDGTLVQLGLVVEEHKVNQMWLLPGRKSIAGSMIGGIKVTQDLLELCEKHGIAPDV